MAVYGGGEGKVYSYHQVSGTPLCTMTGAGTTQSTGAAYEFVDDLTTPVLTLTEADIVVYNKTGAAVVGTSNYNINADSKGLTFTAAYNVGGVSGNIMTISYKARELCAYAQGVTFKVDLDLKSVHGIGSRSPLALVEGPVKIGGSCKQFYNNSTFSYLASESGVLKSLTFDIWPAGNTSYQLRAYECKFTGYAAENAKDGILSDDVEFVGNYYSSSGG